MKTNLVRSTCALIAAYHIIVGVAAVCVPARALQLAPLMYGVSLEAFGAMRPEYAVVVRFIGAFAAALGVMMAYAAMRPARSKGILAGALVFFVLRIVARITGAAALVETLHTSPVRNYGQIGLMALFCITLIIGLTVKEE